MDHIPEAATGGSEATPIVIVPAPVGETLIAERERSREGELSSSAAVNRRPSSSASPTSPSAQTWSRRGNATSPHYHISSTRF
jgi:hypothetical protein